jgi:hypothetical protein
MVLQPCQSSRSGSVRHQTGWRASTAPPVLTLGGWAPPRRSACFCSPAIPHARGLGATFQVDALLQLRQPSRSGSGHHQTGRLAFTAPPVHTLGGWAPPHRSACFYSPASPHARGMGATIQVGVLLQLHQPSRSGAGLHHAGRRASTALPVLTLGGWAPPRRSACFYSPASPHARGLGATIQVDVLLQPRQPSRSGAGRRQPMSHDLLLMHAHQVSMLP